MDVNTIAKTTVEDTTIRIIKYEQFHPNTVLIAVKIWEGEETTDTKLSSSIEWANPVTHLYVDIKDHRTNSYGKQAPEKCDLCGTEKSCTYIDTAHAKDLDTENAEFRFNEKLAFCSQCTNKMQRKIDTAIEQLSGEIAALEM